VRSFETVRFVVEFASWPRRRAARRVGCEGPQRSALRPCDCFAVEFLVLEQRKNDAPPVSKVCSPRCARHKLKADPSPVARASGPRNISRPRRTDAAAHAVILWSIVAHSRCCDAHTRDTRIAASFTRHNFSHTHMWCAGRVEASRKERRAC
jgi:hypothetical protein